MYAGQAELRSKQRSAEVLTEDTPEHVESGLQRLAAVINNCDHGGGAAVKTYSPDTGQAVVQARRARNRRPSRAASPTLLYFTDPGLPRLPRRRRLTDQNYFPENVVVGSASPGTSTSLAQALQPAAVEERLRARRPAEHGAALRV